MPDHNKDRNWSISLPDVLDGATVTTNSRQTTHVHVYKPEPPNTRHRMGIACGSSGTGRHMLDADASAMLRPVRCLDTLKYILSTSTEKDTRPVLEVHPANRSPSFRKHDVTYTRQFPYLRVRVESLRVSGGLGHDICK